MSKQNYNPVYDKVKAQFPELDMRSVTNCTGMQVRFEDFILQYWFRKRKYNDNRRKDWLTFQHTGDIADHIINHIKLKIAAPELAPVQNKHFESITVRSVTLPDDKGTQACIDHIKRKRALIERVKGNNETATMLLVLTEELKQYL
jgi:hypothetical protein